MQLVELGLENEGPSKDEVFCVAYDSREACYESYRANIGLAESDIYTLNRDAINNQSQLCICYGIATNLIRKFGNCSFPLQNGKGSYPQICKNGSTAMWKTLYLHWHLLANFVCVYRLAHLEN